MNTTKTKPINNLPAFAHLGFEAEEAQETVSKLNTLLATYMVHYHKLRNFHWNIVGPDFFELHEKFEQLYNNAKVNIDVIAERIRTLGFKPYSTMEGSLNSALIGESPSVPESRDMASRIRVDIEALIECLVDIHTSATEAGDIATVGMVQRLAEQLEKEHWMLRAWGK